MKDTFICKNCGNSISGKFCSNCGEKVYSQKDNSVLHLLSEGFHFITHFEGSFFNTLKAIFTKPGKFSLDYCNGIRKKYFKPISFFLMLVILYLLFPIFDGLNMKLRYHLTHPLYGNYAKNKVIEVMQLKHLTDSEFGEVFKHTSEKLSKFLLFIIIPVIAFFSWLLSFKKRKYYYDNFIFSIEVVSFFILWGFLILPLLLRILSWVSPLNTEIEELLLIIPHVTLFVIYLIIAAKRFFQFKWWYSTLYSFLFTFILTMFIQYIYKLILFFITMQLI
jgi:hypothetical protein